MTPLLGDPEAFRHAVIRMADPFRPRGVTKVAGLEGMGFAFAGAVAREIRSGLVLLRKPGMIAWDTTSVSFVDYTGQVKGLEIATDALAPGDRVLVVDDWTETGSQMHAAFQLIERRAAEVAGATFVNIDPAVRRDPRFRSYVLHAVLEY